MASKALPPPSGCFTSAGFTTTTTSSSSAPDVASVVAVSTSTAATQTSEEDHDDVNCKATAAVITAAYRTPSLATVDRSVNAVHSPYTGHRGAVRQPTATRLRAAQSPPQSNTATSPTTSSSTVIEQHHLTSLHQQAPSVSRMTANGTCSTLRATEDGGAAGSSYTRPLSSSSQRAILATFHHRRGHADQNPDSDSIMHLRNRPLKAATADDSTANTGGGSGRRRRRSQPFSTNTSSPGTASAPSSPPQRPSIRNFFPLQTIGSVCELFRSQISPSSSLSAYSASYHNSAAPSEPNLALLSIVVGMIEANLTSPEMITPEVENYLCSQTGGVEAVVSKEAPDYHHQHHHHQNGSSGGHSPAEGTPAPNVGSSHATSPLDLPIVTVHYDTVESMLNTFTSQLKDSIDLSKYPKKTSRELIKKISDVIFNNLHRGYCKDRAHVTTLYSYLQSNRLDAYGVAYAVVAACQILGLDDVKLVMSEDHAWVVFGEGETCEVTWHGKGVEDKCGQPLPVNTDCWLYLNGNFMICDRYETIATLVSAMNPYISNLSNDSEDLGILQHQLLWLLYDYGHLRRYPMALGNLGDLEDLCHQGIPRKEPLALFQEAITSAKTYYDDSHVYPYTYMGGYHFRCTRFKDALLYWAEASQVIKKYNYTKDDEEIYKEFQEIANDLIPFIYKNVVKLPAYASMLTDPDCFAALLRFYDGICCWEEGASTPVLHIGWTKPLVATISKFPHATRAQVAIKVDYAKEESEDFDSEIEDDGSEDGRHLSTIGERRRRRAASVSSNNHEETSNGENGHHHHHHNHHRHHNGHSRWAKHRMISIKEEKVDSEVELVLPSPAEVTDSSSSNKPTTWKKPFAVACTDTTGDQDSEDEGKSVVALLSSHKFAGLKNLLTAEKLNTSAIQLQLTAQSQVNVNKRSRTGAPKSGLSSELDFVSTTTTTLARTSSTSNKRMRRE